MRFRMVQSDPRQGRLSLDSKIYDFFRCVFSVHFYSVLEVGAIGSAIDDVQEEYDLTSEDLKSIIRKGDAEKRK